MSKITLHGYWRSSATYRVRIALALKGISYRQIAYDLRAGEHNDAAYRALAPHGLVPALEHDNEVLIESPAILEWIEARWPEPALLPASPDDAAVVRAMAALVACDIHPLNNLRVLAALQSDFGATGDQVRTGSRSGSARDSMRSSKWSNGMAACSLLATAPRLPTAILYPKSIMPSVIGSISATFRACAT